MFERSILNAPNGTLYKWQFEVETAMCDLLSRECSAFYNSALILEVEASDWEVLISFGIAASDKCFFSFIAESW